LILQELNFGDTAFIVELLNSPGWLKFIGDRNVRNEEQAKGYLEKGPIASYAENGFGLYLVETKITRAKIGMCGILKRQHLENPDIGFALLPEFMGKGYAHEMATATLNYASHKLKLSKISAIVQPDNEKSVRLLENIGLKFIKTFRFSDESEELLLYSN
jgi:RimJ/RimL family protein N-acetyltransferase